jgi:hypothetical protein
MSTTGLYEEDLTGTNPLNLITGEVHTLQVPGPDDYYFIIPKAAPYFADSLVVTNHLTGVPYVENEDYLIGHLFIEAMSSIGRPIAGSIRFMKKTIQGQARLQYRTIGGQWGFSDAAILAELSNRQFNPLVRTWAQIDVLPALFPPLEHNQPVDSLVGSAEILKALEDLAAIIEASAEGASQSHITNYNNPHRTTKVHVELGNVQNFAMATDAEATAGARSDLYMSPRGTLLQIQDKALIPLNSHINARGNVHGLVAADINLGNLPNFVKATPTMAVDITNDSSLMTPYTSSLLITQLLDLPRIDALENLIRDHIANHNNPHELTPAILGMYSNAQIDQKLADISGGGGDATTFGGKTPAEWEDGFVAVSQAESIIDQVTTAHADNANGVSDVIVADPTTPEEANTALRQLIGSVQAGYDTYSADTAFSTSWLVQANPQTAGWPAKMKNSTDRWVSLPGAYYYITPTGAVKSVGPNAIQAPPGWKDDVAFLPANACAKIWATKDKVWVQKYVAPPGGGAQTPPGDLYSFTAAGNLTLVSAAANGPVAMFSTGQTKYLGETSVLEDATGWKGFGLPNWVTAFNAMVTAVTALIVAADATDEIADIKIGDDYVSVISSVQGKPYIYQIGRPGANFTLTRVAAPVFHDASGVVATANVVGIQTQTGTFGHFAYVLATGAVVLFGDNSEGQLEVDPASGPYLSAAAGYNFTVTVDTKNNVQFWGNSPDNSLLYGHRGTSIPE